MTSEDADEVYKRFEYYEKKKKDVLEKKKLEKEQEEYSSPYLDSEK